MKTHRTNTVAVDFDGVIHQYGKGWHDGTIYDTPVPGAREALQQLMEKHAVFVFTARDCDAVAKWITIELGIPTTTGCDGPIWDERLFLLVTDKKYPAIAYIDDRGIRFTDWEKALEDLTTYT